MLQPCQLSWVLNQTNSCIIFRAFVCSTNTLDILHEINFIFLIISNKCRILFLYFRTFISIRQTSVFYVSTCIDICDLFGVINTIFIFLYSFARKSILLFCFMLKSHIEIPSCFQPFLGCQLLWLL